MDSVTQAALGAAIGESLLGKKIGNKGALVGALVATIPDLDILVLPFFSDVARISIHRGYSHSILFSLIGAFLVTWLLSRIKWTKAISKTKLWVFSWLVLFTHIMLDAFTSYGTQLFLPISDYRVSFDSVNIVDPMYTVPLLLGLLFSLRFYRNSPLRHRFNQIGLIVSTLYLLGTLAVKETVANTFKETLTENGISYNSLLTVPVGISSINWYGVAKTDDGLYMGKYSNFERNPIELEYFATNDSLLDDLDSVLVDRMKWFAQGYYTVSEQNGKVQFYNLQCDMQGIQRLDGYKAPTAFYFSISETDGIPQLETGVHRPITP